MRKIVILSFISLDGVMQAPGGPDEDPTNGFKYSGWTVPLSDEISSKLMLEQMSMPFELLLGRKTYDIFASYWPQQTGPIAEPFNQTTKYVVSGHHPELAWENSVLIDSDIPQTLQDLKKQDGPMLQVHGSGNLIQTLLKHDLVDELWLKIFPIILGNGKHLFAEGTMPAAFELNDFQITPGGVIFANYKRAGEVTTGIFD